MKKYYDLFDKICTMATFRKAYKNATRGKKHYKDVKAIERYGRNKYLRELLEEVKSKRYKVSEYTIFQLFSGHKWREIYKLPMKDKIVQHAIMIYLEPIFRETFIIDTYSSIKTRGIHLGLQRVKKALKEKNYRYYAKLDIRKCYPSLDKDILKAKLAEKFKDKDLLWLLYTIVDSCPKGVPIGNYTSQYYENFYFSAFDHYMKEVLRVKAYFRYCDDIVILATTKEKLHYLIPIIKEKMAELHVEIKSNWQIYDINVKGIDFLGYIIRNGIIKVRKHTKQNFIKKVKAMDMDNLTERDGNVLGSYWGILGHADCRHLWFKYTGVKTFKDLNISVHNRDFVKDVVGIPMVVTDVHLIQKKGQDWLKIECEYSVNGEKKSDVLIGTSGEQLIEAAKQMNAESFPFSTTIIRNDKGFYEFS